MSSDSYREDPLLVGAVVVKLMGGPDGNNFIHFDKFSNAMEVYGQETYDAYYLIKDIVEAYNDHVHRDRSVAPEWEDEL